LIIDDHINLPYKYSNLKINIITLNEILNTDNNLINKIYKKYSNYTRIGNDEMRNNNNMDILRYSMKVCLIYYLLKYRNLDSVVWIDPDLYFIKNIDNIFETLKYKEVILTPHFRNEYSENRTLLYRDGFFNVGFIGFKKNSICLDWYINQIYLTCDLIDGYFYYEQKYLDYFPILSDNIEILRSGNYNIGEWNMDTCKRKHINNKLYIEKDNVTSEAIFIHFSNHYIKNIIEKNYELPIISTFLQDYYSL
jgi:hypothetical protein